MDDLWIERYAELLGCDPEPGVIAAIIDEKNKELDTQRRTIGKLRANKSEEIDISLFHYDKPIIYLDIDGVLNSYKCRNSFNPICVENLNKIIRTINADIVLSSSWRHLIYHDTFTLKGFEFLLRTHGVDSSASLLGVTVKDCTEISNRSDQVIDSVNKNKVKIFIVLEDCDYKNMPNCIRTNANHGLLPIDVDSAIALYHEQRIKHAHDLHGSTS